jgi:exosortase/archaeosortase family protein
MRKRKEGISKKEFYLIGARYLFLVLMGIFSQVFYLIFLPLTLFPSYFLINLFYKAEVSGAFILIEGASAPIEIVSACVAVSAYYLMLVLNLSTKMSLKKRIYSLAFSLCAFLVLNILRIFILSIMFVNHSDFFDITHAIFWYAISTVFVVLIWFLSAKIFHIENIPLYSDIKRIYLSK